MGEVPPSAYDFLLASHVLEHIANPLKALHTWRRVLKPGGTMVLIAPHRDGTFDHRRPITSMEHILSDFSKDMREDDETHFPEVLALHDLTRDPEAGGRAAFAERVRNNVRYRAVHHHVFSTELVLKLVHEAGLRIEYLDLQLPFHICIVCSVTPTVSATGDAAVAENASYWSHTSNWRRTSPFYSDRLGEESEFRGRVETPGR
jgi:SAM-dependent methyltransferase